LNPFLIRYCTSLALSVTDTTVVRNKPWIGLVSTSILCSFRVSVWYLEGEFGLDRGVTNDFKKVVKSKEIVAFD
jgi:hypothetical protein